jgi:hypothetical protein
MYWVVSLAAAAAAAAAATAVYVLTVSSRELQMSGIN